MPKIKIVVISITSPIQIGLYKENILFETIFLKGQSSDQLPSLFKTFLYSSSFLIRWSDGVTNTIS